jgi:SWIM/SEC-C metal-binding protein
MIFSENKRALKVYDGKKEAKLGTAENPVKVRVKTKEKRKEIASECKKNGWVCEIELAPDKAEDLAGLRKLEKPPKPVKVKETPGRNDPCPCGSGKKYKKCCGA